MTMVVELIESLSLDADATVGAPVPAMAEADEALAEIVLPSALVNLRG
jgi:hypothetical protein